MNVENVLIFSFKISEVEPLWQGVNVLEDLFCWVSCPNGGGGLDRNVDWDDPARPMHRQTVVGLD